MTCICSLKIDADCPVHPDEDDAFKFATVKAEDVDGYATTNKPPHNTLLSISTNIRPPARDGDVGYNLISTEDVIIKTDEVVNVPTGVKVKLPTGYWALILARSSTIFKHHIHVFPGVIDNGYTGELFVPCIAMVKQRVIPKGSSIAQLIMFPAVTPFLEIVNKLPETERGEQGFGSTGV